jgi:amino acid permease
MITLSGILGGVILFTTNGEFLHIAGPAGLLSAIVFVGVTAVCVMEGLSEMVVLWPVSNAMVEYVRAFVDEDLAPVVAIAYWFCSPSRKAPDSGLTCVGTLILLSSQLSSLPRPTSLPTGTYLASGRP